MTPEQLNVYPEGINYEELVNNKELFRTLVYTDYETAVKELKRRQENRLGPEEVVPGIEKDTLYGVMHVSLITPNFETIEFVNMVHKFPLKPLFLEYRKDVFVASNSWKHALGKLVFFHHKGRNGGESIESENIISFNDANGKKICNLKTFWGQTLVDFHHEMFKKQFPEMSINIFDTSKYLQTSGRRPSIYYWSVMKIFLRQAIEFENFYLDNREILFIKDVFLPAFFGIWKEFGLKPLIVPIESFETEGAKHWLRYPYDLKDLVTKKKVAFENRSRLSKICVRIFSWR